MTKNKTIKLGGLVSLLFVATYYLIGSEDSSNSLDTSMLSDSQTTQSGLGQSFSEDPNAVEETNYTTEIELVKAFDSEEESSKFIPGIWSDEKTPSQLLEASSGTSTTAEAQLGSSLNTSSETQGLKTENHRLREQLSDTENQIGALQGENVVLTQLLAKTKSLTQSEWADEKSALYGRLEEWKQWHLQVTADVEHLFVALKTRSLEQDPYTPESTGLAEFEAPAAEEEVTLDHWKTHLTGKRHTKNCFYYKRTLGRPCSTDEGRPCRKCMTELWVSARTDDTGK